MSYQDSDKVSLFRTRDGLACIQLSASEDTELTICKLSQVKGIYSTRRQSILVRFKACISLTVVRALKWFAKTKEEESCISHVFKSWFCLIPNFCETQHLGSF